MNFRLQQFLSAENISQAQFADEIGVARASVSHIIAGRNKPGFDFIQSMALHYPALNLDWLISGKGRMYRDGVPAPQTQTQFVEGQLFETSAEDDREPESPVEVKSKPDDSKQGATNYLPTDSDNRSLPKLQVAGRKITRIVVFYDDNTYQELKEA